MSIRVQAMVAALIFSMAVPGETFRRADIKVVGPIDYGQPSAPVRYTGHPKFSAFEFNAKPGDRLDVTVTAKQGHLVAYLVDASYLELAGGESHFTATIRQDSQPSTYYILVTETSERAVAFTLQLERPSNAAEPAPPRGDRPVKDAGPPTSAGAAKYLSCDKDSQCVAVERAGCCHNGWKDAVNKDKVADYQQANACKDRRTICAMYLVNDDRVAVCETSKRQCVMQKPEEVACGGNMSNAHQCPAGWSCKTANPDVAGICVKQKPR